MKSFRYTSVGTRKLALIVLLVVTFSLLTRHFASSQGEVILPKETCTWSVCSIDTMKLSRDRAREELSDPSFDTVINQELDLIQASGANYVTIDTPYDAEFLPYMKRWTDAARARDLKIWFRGNWSSWEGWFGYPKNMSPSEHIQKTHDFITQNPDLFRDGDIFDACPECENSGHWPQPTRNSEYLKFLQDQSDSLEDAFSLIGADVDSNVASIIGGRAKEVLDSQTVDNLGGVVAIDHYFQNPQNISDYIELFAKEYKAQTLVSEFGAPIPDINGSMSESEQALFLDEVLNNIYKKDGDVLGVNYWVFSHGTTSLVNPDYTSRASYEVVKKYFKPGIVYGKVTTPLGDPVSGVIVATSDGLRISTSENGAYTFFVPRREIEIHTGGGEYTEASVDVSIEENGQRIEQDFVVEPTEKSVWYRIRDFLGYI